MLVFENHDRDRDEDAPTHLLMLGEAASKLDKSASGARRELASEPEDAP